jgi:hypothetical protein
MCSVRRSAFRIEKTTWAPLFIEHNFFSRSATVAFKTIKCPECNTELKSPTGFLLGATVSCPKCETDFRVREDAGAGSEKGADTDAPTKKSAYDADDVPVRSYKNSPLRYAILGGLVIVMLVLGYFLVQKWENDRGVAGAVLGNDDQDGQVVNPKIVIPPGGKGFPKLEPVNPGAGRGRNPKRPIQNDAIPKQPGGNPGAGDLRAGFNQLGGLLGSGSATPAELQAQLQKFKTVLVGTWTADLGGGAAEERTYTAEGTYTAKLTGPDPAVASGKYTAQQLVGTKGLRLQLDDGTGPHAIVVNFDGDELEHPTLQKGVTGTFRKK